MTKEETFLTWNPDKKPPKWTLTLNLWFLYVGFALTTLLILIIAIPSFNIFSLLILLFVAILYVAVIRTELYCINHELENINTKKQKPILLTLNPFKRPIKFTVYLSLALVLGSSILRIIIGLYNLIIQLPNGETLILKLVIVALEIVAYFLAVRPISYCLLKEIDRK